MDSRRHSALGLIGLLFVLACGGGSDTEDIGAATSPVLAIPPELFRMRVPETGAPTWFIIGPGVNLSPDQFLTLYAPTLYELALADEIVEIETVQGPNGYTTIRYRQVHGGYPVLGAGLALDVLKGRVVAGVGHLAAGLATDLNVAVPEGSAKQKALADVALVLGLNKKKPTLVQEPAGQLVIEEQKRRLAWRFIVVTRGPYAERLVDVDARKGAILRDTDAVERVWTPQIVQGKNLNGETVPIGAEVQDNPLETRMQYLPLLTNVFDAQGAADPWLKFNNPADVTNTGAVGFSADSTRGAVTAMSTMQAGISMLKSQFGFSGVDGQGLGLDSIVNVFSSKDVAPYYSPPFNAIECLSGNPEMGYDVLGHELFHAVEQFKFGYPPDSNLNAEVTALRESYSDIFGVSLRHYMTGQPISWVLGSPTLRLLDNPGAFNPQQGDIGQKGAQVYGDAVFDTGDEHQRAGVQDRWFYLLTEGNANVTGVGLLRSLEVMFRTVTQYLLPGADYAAARGASLLAAKKICGEQSQLWVSTWAAWNEVQVAPQSQGTFVFPPDGAIGLEPWPTQLKWQIYPDENTWQLEIDSLPTFDPSDLDYRKLPPITLAATFQENGIDLAGSKLNLRPSTTYYWRVRANLQGAEQMGCARPTHSFQTADVKPELLAPMPGDSAQPWGLKFEWGFFRRCSVLRLHGRC